MMSQAVRKHIPFLTPAEKIILERILGIKDMFGFRQCVHSSNVASGEWQMNCCFVIDGEQRLLVICLNEPHCSVTQLIDYS